MEGAPASEGYSPIPLLHVFRFHSPLFGNSRIGSQSPRKAETPYATISCAHMHCVGHFSGFSAYGLTRSEERLEPTTLASAATSFFKAQEYGKCVVHLERLLQLKEDDPNVRMNCALAAYLDGSCRDALGFIGALERISPFVNGQAAAKDDEVRF
jgi:hypothetical protein